MAELKEDGQVSCDTAGGTPGAGPPRRLWRDRGADMTRPPRRPSAQLSVGLVGLALLPALAVAQGGFAGALAQQTCTSFEEVSAVATRVDAACCTDATCAEGTPTACSPTCGLAMAKLKLGPCAERFRSLTDTANGAPANGVSEAMDVLWDTCKALPTPEVRAAVAAICGETGAGHRRLQADGKVANEELLLSSVQCADPTPYVYPCAPCTPPLPGAYPTWDSSQVLVQRGGMFGGSSVVEIANARGATFTLYELEAVPPAYFSATDADENARKYAALCAAAGLSTVTTGASTWGEPTAQCLEFGCIVLPENAGGFAPNWVRDRVGWEATVTHGAGTARPVNTFDAAGRGGWDQPLRPVCGREHEATGRIDAPSQAPATGIGIGR